MTGIFLQHPGRVGQDSPDVPIAQLRNGAMTTDAQRVGLLCARCLHPHEQSKRKEACIGSHGHLRRCTMQAAQLTNQRTADRHLLLPARVAWQRQCRHSYFFSSLFFRAAASLLNILLMRGSLVSFLSSFRSALSIRRISAECWM